MKVLIFTQAVDQTDPVLGFFHHWIFEFAKKFEQITVICLKQGDFNLPKNVKVLSLGKEKKRSRSQYLIRFYRYIWQERNNYDVVFVHMNQEYVLLGGFLWWLWRKKVSLWRNHPAGNWLTDVAAFWCDQIFCTSKFSYTAKYSKTILMPVGIDLAVFRSDPVINRIPKSILFLARMAPVKRPDMLLGALGLLQDQGTAFVANLYGDPKAEDERFYDYLQTKTKDLGLTSRVSFYPGISNTQTPAIYSRHQIFINLSPSGMYDKTIFEAMACGCLVLVSNDNLKGQIDERLILNGPTEGELATKLDVLLSLSEESRRELLEGQRVFAETQSLALLAEKLYTQLSL